MCEGDFAAFCMLVIMVIFYCSPMLKHMNEIEERLRQIEKRLDIIEKSLYIIPVDGGNNNE